MKTISRISDRKYLIAVATFLAILTASPIPVAASIGAPVNCPTVTQPVTIDGKWTSTTEWMDAPEIQMPVALGKGAGYFRVKHDATTLYILGESLVDVAVEYNSTAGMGDYISVFLDTLYNQGTTPQTDDYQFVAYYVSDSNTSVMTWQGNGTKWITTDPVQGVQATIGLDTGNSPHTPHPHVTFEMSIPLSIIPVLRFGIFIRLDDSTIWWSDTDLAYSMHFFWPDGGKLPQRKNPSAWGIVTIS